MIPLEATIQQEGSTAAGTGYGYGVDMKPGDDKCKSSPFSPVSLAKPAAWNIPGAVMDAVI